MSDDVEKKSIPAKTEWSDVSRSLTGWDKVSVSEGHVVVVEPKSKSWFENVGIKVSGPAVVESVAVAPATASAASAAAGNAAEGPPKKQPWEPDSPEVREKKLLARKQKWEDQDSKRKRNRSIFHERLDGFETAATKLISGVTQALGVVAISGILAITVAIAYRFTAWILKDDSGQKTGKEVTAPHGAYQDGQKSALQGKTLYAQWPSVRNDKVDRIESVQPGSVPVVNVYRQG